MIPPPKAILVLAALLTVSLRPSIGQSTFQNLDFEAATLIPIPGDPDRRVQFAPAFPGWTGYIGTNQQGAALYNNVYLDSSGISIIDQGWSHLLTSGGVIDGNFTAVLQAGVVGSINNPQDTTLSQTALVPASALSLLFKALIVAPGPSGGGLVVKLGGQDLPLIALGSGPNYLLFGADIHSWAGQTAELDFTLIAERPHVNNNYAFLDDIQFSNVSIPEPSFLSLTALAAVFLGCRFLRPRRR